MTTKITRSKTCSYKPSDFLTQDAPESPSSLVKTSKKITKTSRGSDAQSSKSRRPKSTKHLWTPLEDRQLLELRAEHGDKWTLIGNLIGGRSCKQVRDRYLNYLNPSVKLTPFTTQEDQELISLYNQLGRRWKLIADKMAGRSESQVKNRFYRHLAAVLENDKLTVSKLDSICSNSTNGTEACSSGDASPLAQQLPMMIKPTYSFLQAEFFRNEDNYMQEIKGNVSVLQNSGKVFLDVEHYFSSMAQDSFTTKEEEICLL